jgi:hypothetical protein
MYEKVIMKSIFKNCKKDLKRGLGDDDKKVIEGANLIKIDYIHAWTIIMKHHTLYN